MLLRFSCAIADRVAGGAYRFNIIMVFCGIAPIVVIFVSPLTFLPLMSAINACEFVRMCKLPRANKHVYPLSRLFPITIARRLRCRAAKRSLKSVIGPFDGAILSHAHHLSVDRVTPTYDTGSPHGVRSGPDRLGRKSRYGPVDLRAVYPARAGRR